MCKRGYVTTDWDDKNGLGGRNCTKIYSPINNCELLKMVGFTSFNCYGCMKNFAVDKSQMECVAFTFDKYCRQLQADSINCHICWPAYYWDNEKCKLSSNFQNNNLVLLSIFFILLINL